MSSSDTDVKPGLLKQPIAVWAVAFAAVVSFMGIGLVDPILPAIAGQLLATIDNPTRINGNTPALGGTR